LLFEWNTLTWLQNYDSHLNAPNEGKMNTLSNNAFKRRENICTWRLVHWVLWIFWHQIMHLELNYKLFWFTIRKWPSDFYTYNSLIKNNNLLRAEHIQKFINVNDPISVLIAFINNFFPNSWVNNVSSLPC